MFALSTAIIGLVPPAFAVPNIYTYPETAIHEPSETFAIEVKISDALDVFAWDFKLRWNASILNFTGVEEGGFLTGFEETPTYFVNKTYQDEEGLDYIGVACTLLGPDTPGVNGPGTLAIVTFLVESTGETALDLYDSELRDSRISPIEHTETDGLFSNVVSPPTASFTYSPTKPDIDEDVMFNATASSDSDGYIVGYFWDFGDEETADETAPYVYHAYDEGGTYSVALTVTDNTGWNGSVTHDVAVRYAHDIMVISVSESHTTVTVGTSVTITVLVGNVGSEDEGGFDVNVYYDGTVAASSQTVTTLVSGQDKTLTFSWDTAGVAADTYRMKAVASSVSGETYTEDNTELGGTVTVTTAEEFPWLYVGIGGAIVVVIAGAALYFMRRKG